SMGRSISERFAGSIELAAPRQSSLRNPAGTDHGGTIDSPREPGIGSAQGCTRAKSSNEKPACHQQTFGRFQMKRQLLGAAAVLAIVLGVAGSAGAKTLVYCSEASPEGFNPQLFTAGTTFDASSRTIMNRLVEFEHGTTVIKPGLADSWEISDDGLEYT